MNWSQILALILVIIGAINWGLIGLFQFDLVATIFGGQEAILAKIIYTIVGLSGLYALTIFLSNTEFDAREDDKGVKDIPSYDLEIGDEVNMDKRNNHKIDK